MCSFIYLYVYLFYFILSPLLNRIPSTQTLPWRFNFWILRKQVDLFLKSTSDILAVQHHWRRSSIKCITKPVILYNIAITFMIPLICQVKLPACMDNSLSSNLQKSSKRKSKERRLKCVNVRSFCLNNYNFNIQIAIHQIDQQIINLWSEHQFPLRSNPRKPYFITVSDLYR